MNDVFKSSEILQFAMYADETCVYNSNISATDNARIMNSELSLVSRWLDRNCLILNIKKCHYVHIKRKRHRIREGNFNILINDVRLDRCTFTEYLGVNIYVNFT